MLFNGYMSASYSAERGEHTVQAREERLAMATSLIEEYYAAIDDVEYYTLRRCQYLSVTQTLAGCYAATLAATY